jgi:hypothetical protein
VQDADALGVDDLDVAALAEGVQQARGEAEGAHDGFRTAVCRCSDVLDEPSDVVLPEDVYPAGDGVVPVALAGGDVGVAQLGEGDTDGSEGQFGTFGDFPWSQAAFRSRQEDGLDVGGGALFGHAFMLSRP